MKLPTPHCEHCRHRRAHELRGRLAALLKRGLTMKEAAWELQIPFKTARYHKSVLRGTYRRAKAIPSAPSRINTHDMDIAFKAICFITRRYAVACADLEGSCREERIVWPRWLAILLIRRHTALTLAKIGFLFNRKEESIRHALLAMEDRVNTNCAQGVEVANLITEFQSTNKQAEP